MDVGWSSRCTAGHPYREPQIAPKGSLLSVSVSKSIADEQAGTFLLILKIVEHFE